MLHQIDDKDGKTNTLTDHSNAANDKTTASPLADGLDIKKIFLSDLVLLLHHSKENRRYHISVCILACFYRRLWSVVLQLLRLSCYILLLLCLLCQWNTFCVFKYYSSKAVQVCGLLGPLKQNPRTPVSLLNTLLGFGLKSGLVTVKMTRTTHVKHKNRPVLKARCKHDGRANCLKMATVKCEQQEQASKMSGPKLELNFCCFIFFYITELLQGALSWKTDILSTIDEIKLNEKVCDTHYTSHGLHLNTNDTLILG